MAKRKAPSTSTPIRGLAPGSIVRGWRVFASLDPVTLEDGSKEPEAATARRRKLAERYGAMTIDVRRTTRARVRRLSSEIALAVTLFDEVADLSASAKAAEGEDEVAKRKAALDALEAAEGEMNRVFGAICEEQATNRAGDKVGPLLAAVYGVVVELEDGKELDLADASLEDQLYVLEELGLLDSVGQAVLRAQSTEEANLRL